MTGRQGRRHKRQMDDHKEMRVWWKLKEEAVDRTLWGNRFGRGYGPTVRQSTEWILRTILCLLRTIISRLEKMREAQVHILEHHFGNDTLWCRVYVHENWEVDLRRVWNGCQRKPGVYCWL